MQFNVSLTTRRAAVPAFIAGLGLFVAPALAQFSLDSSANYTVGQQPDGTAAADFNNDGIADIASTADQNTNSDDVAILIGNADGTFQAPFYVPLPNSSSPGDVVAGDLDGDGDIDLAIGLKDPNQVILVRNNGGANFSLGGTAPTGAEPRGMDIGDADGDGDLDLVVANREGNTATFLRNNGAGAFTASTMGNIDEPRDAAFGDFDGDGDLDFAISSHDDRTVRVFQNNGASFSQSANLSVGGNDRPEGMDAADIDGDGLDDIATASGDDDSPNQNRAILFFANSASSFTGPIYVFAGPNATDTSDVAVADLDCDGDLDLATVNELTNNISIMLNQGGGAFGPAQQFPAGSNPDHIIAASLQDDGDFDIIAGNRNSNNITVLLNGCGTGTGPVCGDGVCDAGEDSSTCPGDCPPAVFGDLTSDGQVNAADLALLLGAWSVPAGSPGCDGATPCAADFNEDGLVNAADLALLLGAWTS